MRRRSWPVSRRFPRGRRRPILRGCWPTRWRHPLPGGPPSSQTLESRRLHQELPSANIAISRCTVAKLCYRFLEDNPSPAPGRTRPSRSGELPPDEPATPGRAASTGPGAPAPSAGLQQAARPAAPARVSVNPASLALTAAAVPLRHYKHTRLPALGRQTGRAATLLIAAAAALLQVTADIVSGSCAGPVIAASPGAVPRSGGRVRQEHRQRRGRPGYRPRARTREEGARRCRAVPVRSPAVTLDQRLRPRVRPRHRTRQHRRTNHSDATSLSTKKPAHRRRRGRPGRPR